MQEAKRWAFAVQLECIAIAMPKKNCSEEAHWMSASVCRLAHPPITMWKSPNASSMNIIELTVIWITKGLYHPVDVFLHEILPLFSSNCSFNHSFGCLVGYIFNIFLAKLKTNHLFSTFSRRDENKVSRVTIYFKDDLFKTFRREEAFYTAEFILEFGGLHILLLGVVLLLFMWFIVHLVERKQRNVN